ncbi:unnamed protein product, partial [Mesorhabditis belari]|uniref:F-box domain-containing protein n=1 Tax=Mesorhabditis belari TaxID=2138241 RepID=A0AAF3EDD1_9BILA
MSQKMNATWKAFDAMMAERNKEKQLPSLEFAQFTKLPTELQLRILNLMDFQELELLILSSLYIQRLVDDNVRNYKNYQQVSIEFCHGALIVMNETKRGVHGRIFYENTTEPASIMLPLKWRRFQDFSIQDSQIFNVLQGYLYALFNKSWITFLMVIDHHEEQVTIDKESLIYRILQMLRRCALVKRVEISGKKVEFTTDALSGLSYERIDLRKVVLQKLLDSTPNVINGMLKQWVNSERDIFSVGIEFWNWHEVFLENLDAICEIIFKDLNPIFTAERNDKQFGLASKTYRLRRYRESLFIRVTPSRIYCWMASASSSHTMRCINCQGNLTANSGPQCEKCRKNEEKYGKPTNCTYCKLPAAFTEEKCVYCCSSERKHGSPVPCANCKMKSAFARHPKKPALCRLCVMIARQQGVEVMNGIPVPPEKGFSHRDHNDPLRHHSTARLSSSSKKRHPDPPKKEASPHKQPKLDTSVLAVNSQNVIQMQQLQEKVDELQRVANGKDKLLLRKDAEIAQLKADISTAERKYREMLAQMAKEKDEALEKLQRKFEDERKQHRLEKQEKERIELQEKAKREKERKAKKEKEKQEAAEKRKKEKEEKADVKKVKEEEMAASEKKENEENETKAKMEGNGDEVRKIGFYGFHCQDLNNLM